MKFKKALATVLAICVAITFMPITPVSAAATVEYKRDNPEVAILNAINGNSTQFYNKLLSSQKDASDTYYTDKTKYGNKYAYLNYNSANKFYGIGAGYVDYEDQLFGSSSGAISYNFNGYGSNSVLYKLGKVNDNLEANLSVTFHNNKHAHSANYFQDEWLTAYTGVLFYANGEPLAGGYGSSELSYANFRIGNYEFHKLSSNSKDSMKLLVSASKLAYSKGTCTCFSHADNTVVAFRDTRAPKIQSVTGNIDTDRYFQKNDKITIEIKFDEPIRFADDSATGKDSLGVELMLSKSSEGSWPVAKLTKLEGDTLYFEYTVPADSTINDQITGISLKSLAGSGIKLVQVKESDNFEITAPDGEGSDGYSTTTCYITDLAGNPALTGKNDSNAVKSLSAYIDTQGPAPVKMDVSAETNNSDIKDTLEKTDSSAKDYKNKSDYYLGAGDTLHYTIYMDELLAGLPKKSGEEDVPKYPYSNDYTNFHAKTNLYDASGNQVTLDSRFYYNTKSPATQWGLGASNGCVTAFDMDFLTITDGMHIKDNGNLKPADGEQIKITEVYFTDDSGAVISIKDYCGNTASGSFDVASLNTAKFYVDTEPPEITTSAVKSKTDENGNAYYKPTEEVTDYGTGFKIPITIDDSSDVDGLNGRFMWRNDTGSSDKYKFKYAITGSETAPAKDSDSWKDGIMTTQYSFTQISGTMYIHICPIKYDNKASNITGSTLLISGSDYAGNQGSLYAYTKSNGVKVEKKCAELKLDWQLDGVAPEATVCSLIKSLEDKSRNGILKVGIKLTDATGIKEAKYIWANAGGTAPTGEDNSWKSMTITEETVGTTGWSEETVAAGTDFSKELWIKVSDFSDNTLIKSMGEYSYRLSGVDYNIQYNNKISPGADIKLAWADKNDAAALVFMVKAPDSAYEYFVRVLGAKAGNINSDEAKVFNNGITLANKENGKALAWTRMKVTENNGSYTFEKVESSDDSYIKSIIEDWTYSGNLDVTVISGLQTAFKWDEISTSMPLEAGTTNTSSSVKTDTVSLRISSDYPEADDAFENVDASSGPVKLTLMSELPKDTTLNTLEGLEFKVEIGADKNGWDWEDVNYANSYIAIQKSGSSTTTKVKLSSTPSQTVVISEEDFPENSENGYYNIWLEIDCDAGKDYSTKDNPCKLFVDTTPASTQFAIDSVTYKPYMFKDNKTLYSIGEYNDSDGLSLKITPVGSKTEKQTAGEDGAATTTEEIVQDKKSNILYLPTSPGGETKIANNYVNYLNLSATDIADEIGGSYGDFKYKIWNLTSDVDLTASEKNAYTVKGTSGVISVPIKTVSNAKAYDEAAGSDKTFFYLIDGTVNTIALQVVKTNGRDSEIKYYNIYPTSSVATGTASVTTLDGVDEVSVVSGGYVMFKPDDGADMSDAHVYATVDKTTVIELFADASGKYKAELWDGRHSYWVHTIDKYGNIEPLSWLTAVVDTEGPVITCTSSSCTDGHYEATFKITDMTLHPYRYYEGGAYGVGAPRNIDISLTIDDDHAAAIGVTPGAQTNIHTDWDDMKNTYGGSEYHDGNDDPDYLWTLSQISANGIYEVSWVIENSQPGKREDCYIELTVKGAVGYDSKTVEEGKVNFDLNLEASDIFGNTSATKVSYTEAANVKPHITEHKLVKSDDNYGEGTLYDHSLQMSFNIPVQPDASWILPETEGYSGEQKEAFPITRNGSYDIGFTDIFGNHWTQKIDITEFTEGQESANNGIELSFSTTDLTKEAVEISAKALSENNSNVKMIFIEQEKDGEGSYKWHILDETEDAKAGELENEKKITISENKYIWLLYYDTNAGLSTWDDLYSSQYWVNRCIEAIPIHIRNIANEAPSAKLHFYFEEYGDTYTEDNLPRDKGSTTTTATTGAVTVSYNTSRAVSPINGTGSSITFRYGDTVTSHTFEYEDAAGNKGSVTVDLTKLGITFAAPPVPYVDRNAPIVNVDVMAKRFGTYSASDAFSARTSSSLTDETLKTEATSLTTSGVKSAFDNTSYVQDYNLKLKIEDESDFKIVLMKTAPSGTLSYDSTTGDTINSVKVSGNIVNISKDAVTNLTDSTGTALTSFTVVVIDSANNYTYFTVNKSEIVDWFDNQAPTAVVEVKAETSLYSRTVYVSITDTQDNTDADGNKKTNLNGATVNGLDFEKVNETLSKKVYTDNDETTITYYDIVGNTSSATIAVDDIDTEAPVLTTTWSPGAEVKDSTGKVTQIDEKNPTTGPVSTAVTATVKSSRPIQDGTVEILGESDGREYWNKWKLSELRNEYDGESVAEYIAKRHGVELSYTSEMVTARFVEDGVKMRLTVTALNGRSSETKELEIKDGVIKTEAADLTVSQKELKWGECAIPYAVEITIAPNDYVYCQTDTAKDGEKKKQQYSSTNPFKTTVYKDGTYQYSFVDKAGNVSVASVKVDSGIDNTAPVITADPENTIGMSLTNGNVTIKISPNEDVWLSWDDWATNVEVKKDGIYTIEFKANGTYRIQAEDLAGNTSSKYVSIGNISKIAPTINFDKSTLSVRQGTAKDDAEFVAQLKDGVNCYSKADSKMSVSYTYNLDDVELNTVGTYEAVYTATDSAGNKGTATRYIKVFSKDLPTITIDGEPVDNESTFALAKGEHTLVMSGLKKITSEVSEPYTVKFKKGKATKGQMKYFESTVAIDNDGKFTLGSKGFYTIYIVTQSRQEFIATLYVE